MRRFVLAASLVFAASRLQASGPFMVNSTADQIDDNPGDGSCHTSFDSCTLRAAVMEANKSSGAVIVLPAGHYELSLPPTCTNDSDACGDLNVTASMMITGAGAATTLIDASGLGDGIFHVESPAILTITGVTLEHSSGTFGGVYVASGAELGMIESRITDCHAGSGGGVTASGTVALVRTTIDSCSAGAGGAISVGSATVTLTSCTLSGNSSNPFSGGAISTGSAGSILILRDTTVSGNTASGFSAASGGGIAVGQTGSGGSCVIVNSTISGNNATQDGGGIYNGSGAQTSLFNSTVTKNQSDSDFNGSGVAGGVYNASGTVSLRETILAGNWETAQFNNIYILIFGDCYGTLTTNGENLLEGYSNCNPGAHFTTADPKLAALADNGGLTTTHLPIASSTPGESSPAIDAGTSGCVDESSNPLTVDQRGVVRPIGSHCDIGAVELEPEGDVNGDGTVNVADVFYLINFLFAGGPIPKGRANVNADTSIDVADVFYLINFLFAGGPAPK
jgi:CSLREA domain-containing protein